MNEQCLFYNEPFLNNGIVYVICYKYFPFCPIAINSPSVT